MWFWLFLLIGLVFGALGLVSGGGEAAADGEGGSGLVLLTVIGLGMISAGILRVLWNAGGDAIRHAATWVVIFGFFIGLFAFRGELMDIYDRMSGEQVASVAMTRAGGEAELRRAWDGHYRAEAVINGAPIRLLVDTGASMVVLPFEEVARLGIDPKSLNFSVPVSTANGHSTVAPIRLESISVGEIEVRNVPAAVSQPGRLKTGLLGMSFLDEMDETVFQGDRLVLRQNTLGALNSRFKQAPEVVDGMFPPEAQNLE